MKKVNIIFVLLIFSLIIAVIFTACDTKENNKDKSNISFIVEEKVYKTFTVEFGDTVVLPDNPTKNGYTFDGWYFDKDVWEEKVTESTLLDNLSNKYVFVYAKWIVKTIINIEIDMSSKYYLASDGKDVDLVTLFDCNKGTTFTSASSGITITGSIAKITSKGDKVISIIIDEDTKTVTINASDNGVNVSTSNELYAAANEKKVIYVIKDIDLDSGTVNLYNNLYGNGKQIYCYGAYVDTEIHSSIAFEILGENILIQDAHFIGLKPSQDNFDLTIFEQSGKLFNLYGGANLGYKPGATFKNCIIENSHVGIRAENANVTIDGSILRNASDSCLSIGTTNKGASIIKIKNTIMANAVIATICNWCTEDNIRNENFVVFNFEGFFDAYNWKNDKTIKLIPGTEGAIASIGNSIISSEVKKSIYDDFSFIYKYDNNRWLNIAMLAISTGNTENKPVLNGLNNVKMESNSFPLPGAASAFLKNAILIGYTTNTINDVAVKPNTDISDNENLYKDLREGRK